MGGRVDQPERLRRYQPDRCALERLGVDDRAHPGDHRVGEVDPRRCRRLRVEQRLGRRPEPDREGADRALGRRRLVDRSEPCPVAAGRHDLAGSVLTGISAVAPTDIWAVGSFSVSSGTTVDSLTLTMHYDGTAWRVVPSPNVAVRHPLNGARQVLGGVEAVRHDDVWAVGNTIDTASGSFLPDKTLILHWNGTAWSVVPSPDSPAEDVLSGVSALSPTDVWAVGQFVDRSGSTPIARTRTLHWNGAAWSVVASPNGPAGDTILNGVSAVPATGEVWAAGFTLASTPGSRTFVLHHGG